ncbi:alternative ribosome rescue aminoacyl-tRNA hydrolase ArfB [Aurantiacibacter sp. MUD11]|uniref:alternative ribosome rescue aminoacyl-tRNA hydrolase ArfB n=1 Tax=Aurantiacibacter sp. MUD11 TaxID=3003265 RepID=UPI0022AA0816|nr:alternative ribosome rescue aminoacyl-tRNA hydrolase ArfB [Aurantiacibacter sp. MUD11]WAT16979.1 alternative ribosome rescue aminoacyl-tRNA hydrolase ArfB [Aurantiacibacter sp. MUD11]
MGKILERANAIAEESFIAASGPGGQNVNKVATAVQLRVNIYALGLPPRVFHRLKELAGSRLNQAGEIVIDARNNRTQEANRREARERLAELIESACREPKKRAKSRVNRVGKTKRLASKKAHGQKKALRGKVDL